MKFIYLQLVWLGLLFFSLISNAQESEHMTEAFQKMKGDVVIQYRKVFDHDISNLKKNDPNFTSERVVYFNRKKLVSKLTYVNPKSAYLESLTYVDFKREQVYYLKKYRQTKSGAGYYQSFSEDEKLKPATLIEGESKEIAGYNCKKYEVIIKGEKKYLYTTEKFGLKNVQNFDIDGIEFFMELPKYSKRYGHYKLVAEKVIFTNLDNTAYNIEDYYVISKEEFKKKEQESKDRAAQIKDKAKNDFLGNKAPDIRCSTTDFDKVKTKDYRGKVIVYNFWFSTCKSCIMEVPKLNELYNKYKDNSDVIFLALSLDPAYKIEKFNRKYNFQYPQVEEARELAHKFEVALYPTNIVIDKDGNYINYTIGYKKDIVDRLSYSIDKALAKEYIPPVEDEKSDKNKGKKKKKSL
ncbi:TlpA disulfide reductase family protein [Flammeovirga sp. SubArs3]|uniref:TlpA family protein disulfide reductase n=1 Tax=Flammeovirga sp. SubArs3 TaxID=2995316 RepID=UPI00248CC502|nr:TlpA disulfide reductase family protein [Flammeovirga sp. SubArs3]